ncbi:hypothetical protein ACE193_17875 [Bernardetia sp. OM2101]|uniref:hypothetical protein n=1 Tax=Bernardetia sp. OM2101 TaxID=3344876 RepID=UPI0035D120EC
MPPIIKLSSITNLHDARFGAGMGTLLEVMIGFSLNPKSENYVSEQDFVQISGWITGCKTVVEIEGDTISDEAQKILSNKDYTIDFIQVSDLALLLELKMKEFELPIIYTDKLEKKQDLKALSIMYEKLKTDFGIEYFLIESNQENLSEKDIQTLKNITKELPIILGFGITNENVIDLLSQTQVKGIAFKGQTETEVGMGGYTDFDEISDILEKVEEL